LCGSKELQIGHELLEILKKNGKKSEEELFLAFIIPT
jgi:hypothetical protein